MTEKEIEKVIEKAVSKAVKVELGGFKVESEQHYQDHMWLSDWRKWQTTIKSATLRTAVGIVLTALATLIFYGFLFVGGGKH